MLGTSGVVEAAICAAVLATGLLPPTYNLDDPDPQCPLDHVLKEPRPAAISYALSNSFGFGGQNVSLLLGRTSASLRVPSSAAPGVRSDDQLSSDQQGSGT
jgi:3-oxoacyl-[acyl-carrier-protein] synthase II